MRLDAMLGKSTCGVEEKIKEPTVEEAKRNIEMQRERKCRKPYPIPAASLINKNNKRENI